ncbi:MAG: DNA polymerase III subunit [Saccharofermentanales bacterium]
MAGFSALTGQYDLKARLGRAIAVLPGHAFIFAGPEGIGRHTFASEFARGLLCSDPGPDGGCGACRSCICFREGTHPDYKEILLNAKDKTIKTDNVRKVLVGDIGMMPQISKRKVYFISADDLNEQSQNVILKTLEEPPEYAVIILSANSLQSVLPTVLSRSIPVGFERYTLSEVEEIIAAKGFKDKGTSGFFAKLADGIPGAALSFLENDGLSGLRDEVIDHAMKLPIAGRAELMLDYYPFFEENKPVIEELLLILNAWFRDTVVYLSTGESGQLINKDKSRDIKEFSEKNHLTIEKMLRSVQIAEKARVELGLNAGFEICICNMLLMLRKELSNA